MNKIMDFYFRHPIKIDFFLTSLILYSLYLLQVRGHIFFRFTKESLSDVLNELISSSMSLGGFVLAAMAIIAAIKDNTKPESNLAKTPQQRVLYSKVYNQLVDNFTGGCVLFIFSFGYFSVLRTITESLNGEALFYLTYLGIMVSFTTIARCIWLIQAIIKL